MGNNRHNGGYDKEMDNDRHNGGKRWTMTDTMVERNGQ